MTAPAPPSCASCAHFRQIAGPMLDPKTGRSVALGDCARGGAPVGLRFSDDTCAGHAPKAP